MFSGITRRSGERGPADARVGKAGTGRLIRGGLYDRLVPLARSRRNRGAPKLRRAAVEELAELARRILGVLVYRTHADPRGEDEEGEESGPAMGAERSHTVVNRIKRNRVPVVRRLQPFREAQIIPTPHTIRSTGQ